MGYDVYCLSADTPSAQAKWQTKVCLLRSFLFSLASFVLITSIVLLFRKSFLITFCLTATGSSSVHWVLGRAAGPNEAISFSIRAGCWLIRRCPLSRSTGLSQKNCSSIAVPIDLRALRFLARGWLWSLSRPRS